tara:strand:- start:170 stop:508 length:339 start_codon:yes stop_codon:yes gene_type:complete
MSHYAKIENGLVTEVLVSSYENIELLSGEWIRTSYNMSGGVHSRGLAPLRYNFASVGMVYDSARDAFYTQKPHQSWIFDEVSCTWTPPTEMPSDGNIYRWSESTTSWLNSTP